MKEQAFLIPVVDGPLRNTKRGGVGRPPETFEHEDGALFQLYRLTFNEATGGYQYAADGAPEARD